MEECFGRKPLLQQIYDEIENCQTMEYLWSQKKDDVKHTAVVLKFGFTPKFSIDFGADIKTAKDIAKVVAVGACVSVSGMSGSVSGSSSSSSSSTELGKKLAQKVTVEGKVTISDFLPSESKIMGKLVKLSLRNKEEKTRAIRVFNGIKEMKFEDYQVMTKNCRNYVDAIAKYLKKEIPEFKKKNWNLFEEEMEKIKNEDNEKLEKSLSSPFLFQRKSSKQEKYKAGNNEQFEEIVIQQESLNSK